MPVSEPEKKAETHSSVMSVSHRVSVCESSKPIYPRIYWPAMFAQLAEAGKGLLNKILEHKLAADIAQYDGAKPCPGKSHSGVAAPAEAVSPPQ